MVEVHADDYLLLRESANDIELVNARKLKAFIVYTDDDICLQLVITWTRNDVRDKIPSVVPKRDSSAALARHLVLRLDEYVSSAE